MKEIMVSVVMPCLNSRDFIGEAIESVLNQTLKDIELIIVDAGSKDGTIEVINAYKNKDDRIKLLHSDKKSMGYQYNMGMRNAKGKYIGFVESDDYVDTEMYRRFLEVAEDNNLDFVKSDFDMFIGDKDKKFMLNYIVLSLVNEKLYSVVLNPTDYPEIIYRDVNMWNGLYKREFIKKNEIYLNETAGAAFQDMGFVQKSFMKASRIMYLHIPSYYYRKDNINASVYNKAKHIKFIMDEMNFIMEFMNKDNINHPFRAVVFNRFFGTFCSYYDEYKDINNKVLEIENQLEDCFEFIKNCYKELEYQEINKENVDKMLSMIALLRSVKDFEVVRSNIAYNNKKLNLDFFKFIKNRNIIIFGAGEVGKSIYACLYRNDIKSVLCFCDNDVKKQGIDIMGLKCLSLDDIKNVYLDGESDICFVIANINYFKDIEKQLLANGIDMRNIIKSIDIIPHIAFELNMEEIENE